MKGRSDMPKMTPKRKKEQQFAAAMSLLREMARTGHYDTWRKIQAFVKECDSAKRLTKGR